MKILIQSRNDLYTKFGGDTQQILRTSKYLEKLGVFCKISTELTQNVEKYDIVHIFNITRPYELYWTLKKAKEKRIPIVFSPIYIDLRELDKKGRYGLTGMVTKRINSDNVKEFLKNIIRFSFLSPNTSLLFLVMTRTHASLVREMLNASNLVLTNSKLEYDAFVSLYSSEKPFGVIYNGVDMSFENAHAGLFNIKYGLNNIVLCVANFSAVKNQINLVRALSGTDIQLVLIGNRVPGNKNYFSRLHNAVQKNNCLLLERVPRNMIASAYHAAKVHILPSRFETCGIANLEAGLSGCNIVSTNRGYAREYFGDMVEYCDPGNIPEIRNVIKRTYKKPQSNELRSYIKERYSWEKAVNQLLGFYKEVANP